MDQILSVVSSWWQFLVDHWIGALVVGSLVVLILASVLALLSTRRLREQKVRDERAARRDLRYTTRLVDVHAQIGRHNAIVMWNAIVANITMVGQYLVGAALGASFFQTTVDPKITGLLGVWVVVATAISKHYRPALRASQAKGRKLGYQALARNVEDGILAIERRNSNAPNEAGLRKLTSAKLKDLDDLELSDDRVLSPLGRD